MRFGVCYYPEQWPEERWAADAAAMADLGIEVVRIGEFAWSLMEPRRGEFSWGWLDRAIETLADSGLSVILGTPTATPPVWLMREMPSVLAVGDDGRRKEYGSRRHTCPTSVEYRGESARIIEVMVERFGSHEAVMAWQIDNEPGNHDSARCWCDQCQAAFTNWLGDRYSDVDTLNDRWGSAFWSMTYPDFESVRLPIRTVTSHNPSLLLAHRRFAASQVVSALREQVDTIRSGSGKTVTSNLYFGDREIDPRAIAGLGGVASFDVYPQGTDGVIETAFNYDLHRSAAPQAWVMEHQVGRINWTERNDPVPPGQIALWMRSAADHGVDLFSFFRWRAGRGGQEQYHSGLLDHDGLPGPGYEEIRKTIAELSDYTPADAPRAALLWDIEDLWLLDDEVHAPYATHSALTLAAYEALVRAGYAVDVVDPDDSYATYDVVAAPGLHIVTDERVARIDEALQAGATVIIGPRSLVRTVDGMWTDDPIPAGVNLGARVADAGTPPEGARLKGGGDVGPWAEVLEVETATVALRYEASWFDGRAAAVRNGPLWYLGASSREAWSLLIEQATGRSAGSFAPMGDASDLPR